MRTGRRGFGCESRPQLPALVPLEAWRLACPAQQRSVEAARNSSIPPGSRRAAPASTAAGMPSSTANSSAAAAAAAAVRGMAAAARGERPALAPVAQSLAQRPCDAAARVGAVEGRQRGQVPSIFCRGTCHQGRAVTTSGSCSDASAASAVRAARLNSPLGPNHSLRCAPGLEPEREAVWVDAKARRIARSGPWPRRRHAAAARRASALWPPLSLWRQLPTCPARQEV